jgi:hypothetical protein
MMERYALYEHFNAVENTGGELTTYTWNDENQM